MQAAHPLSGYRFLVVEDEMMQAWRLGDMLVEMGGEVGRIAFGYEQARDAIDDASFDCALLDINLGGTLAFPIADMLRERGIPFVFCTAYADAVEVYAGASHAPRVDKPVQPIELRDAVLTVMKSRERRS